MIILTGASGGIGREILPMLSELDDVIALYHSTPPEIVDSKRIASYKINLSSEQEVKGFCARVKKDLKKITLIHAAALSRDGLAAQLDVNDWDMAMDVNLRGNFLITRELLWPMISEKWGRVIHLSSECSLKL